MSTHLTLVEVIKWSVAAAKEHCESADRNAEVRDPDTSMGLWQSFQATFPKEDSEGRAIYRDYDILVTAYSETFSAVVKAMPLTVPS